MHWYYCYHIIILSIISNFHEISCDSMNCLLSYHAEEIDYNDASLLNYYYTSVGIKSVDECAIFCFHRQFCRTAVYNYFANTCSISYNWVVNCWKYSTRYSQYHSPAQQLVRIACIDGCTMAVPKIKARNELQQTNDALAKLGIEVTRTAAKTTTTTAAVTTTNITKTTTATSNIITNTTTTSTTTTTATVIAIPKNTTDTETITTVEENDTINSVIDTTPIAITSALPIQDTDLPSKTISHLIEDETLQWLNKLGKLFGGNMSNYRSIIETFDHKNGSTANIFQTFISDINAENKLRLLEDIVHEIQENPNKYHVSVESTEADQESWIVIHMNDYRKRKNMHATIFKDTSKKLNQLPLKHDSPKVKNLKPNYHLLRIQLPYEFLNGSSLNEEKIRQDGANINQNNTTSAMDVQQLNYHHQKPKFKKLPEEYIDQVHGYKYRIEIHDTKRKLSLTNNTSNDNEMQQQKKTGTNNIGRTENRDNNTIKKTSTIVNSSCFAAINRQLLYNASYKTIYDISLERCRCACISTWKNAINNDCIIKCRSFQYSNVTRKCSLNEGDHKGNYHLVYIWDTNYFYRICDDKEIEENAMRNCPTNEVTKTEQFPSEWISTSRNSTLTIAAPRKTSHSTRKRSTTDYQSMPSSTTDRKQSVYRWKNNGEKNEVGNSTIIEEVILSPVLWSKILTKKSVAKNLKSLVFEVWEKYSEEITVKKQYDYWIKIGHDTTTTKTLPHLNRGIRSTKNTDLEANADDNTKITTIKLPTSLDNKFFTSTTNKPETIETTERVEISGNNEKSKKSNYEMTSSIANLTTSLAEQQTTTDEDLEVNKNDEYDRISDDYNKNYDLNGNDITTVTALVLEGSGEIAISDEFTENSKEDVNKTDNHLASKMLNGSCFEVIDGFILKGAAGGLEENVSLEECQCYCANSRNNERYSFQCISATYYHNERDCILNLATKNEFPRQFEQQNNVTYMEMICSVEDSIQLLINTTLIHGCRQTDNIPTSTTKKPEEILKQVSNDSCFIGMPNHVLHGTAFAVEINVSVEACKCYCMSTEARYDTPCRSFEYLFDSRTCLLNNLSRITNPEIFNHSSVNSFTHSYFEKTCPTEINEFSMYMKEKCSFILVENEIKNDTNAIIHSDKITNIYDSTHPIQHVKHRTNSDDLSEEDGEEEKKKFSKNDEFRFHNITTVSATTAMSTGHFIAVTKSFLEPSATESFSEPTITESLPRPIVSEPFPESTVTESHPKSTVTESLPEPSVTESFPESTVTDSHPKPNVTESLPEPSVTGSFPEPTVTESLPEPIDTTTALASTTTTGIDFTGFIGTSRTTPEQVKTYPNPGKCVYSAIYRSSFRGRKLIKRFPVSSPQQCFYGCHYEKCRSSNLYQVDSQIYFCELYRDALIDYRTADVLAYDNGSVYFDGIKCTKRRKKYKSGSYDENDHHSTDYDNDDDYNR